jgi:hypothetical protein
VKPSKRSLALAFGGPRRRFRKTLNLLFIFASCRLSAQRAGWLLDSCACRQASGLERRPRDAARAATTVEWLTSEATHALKNGSHWPAKCLEEAQTGQSLAGASFRVARIDTATVLSAQPGARRRTAAVRSCQASVTFASLPSAQPRANCGDKLLDVAQVLFQHFAHDVGVHDCVAVDEHVSEADCGA